MVTAKVYSKRICQPYQRPSIQVVVVRTVHLLIVFDRTLCLGKRLNTHQDTTRSTVPEEQDPHRSLPSTTGMRTVLVSSSFVDGRAGQEGCATSRPPSPLIRYRTRKFKLNFDKHDFEVVDTRTAKLPL